LRHRSSLHRHDDNKKSLFRHRSSVHRGAIGGGGGLVACCFL
jgi:hypothetical protein